MTSPKMQENSRRIDGLVTNDGRIRTGRHSAGHSISPEDVSELIALVRNVLRSSGWVCPPHSQLELPLVFGTIRGAEDRPRAGQNLRPHRRLGNEGQGVL